MNLLVPFILIVLYITIFLASPVFVLVTSFFYGFNTKKIGVERILGYLKCIIIPLVIGALIMLLFAHGAEGFPDGHPSPFTLESFIQSFLGFFIFLSTIGTISCLLGIFTKHIKSLFVKEHVDQYENSKT